MKRVLSVFIAIILAVSICGCSSAENTNSESESSEGYKRDGYEYADYDKYGSSVEGSSLINEYVYIKGVVENIFDLSDMYSLSVVSDTDKTWLCTYNDLKYNKELDKIFDGKEILCFGKYVGYNTTCQMPQIKIDKIECNEKIYTAENLRKLKEPNTTVSSSEIEKPTEELTTQKATEPTTEKPTEKSESLKTDAHSNSESSNSKSNIASSLYQSILDTYSAKLKAATPDLINEYNQEAVNNINGLTGLAEIANKKVSKLAEISNEGVRKMAEVMYSKGSGSYSVYEDWAEKLYSVYEEEAGKIYDVYTNSAL